MSIKYDENHITLEENQQWHVIHVEDKKYSLYFKYLMWVVDKANLQQNVCLDTRTPTKN